MSTNIILVTGGLIVLVKIWKIEVKFSIRQTDRVSKNLGRCLGGYFFLLMKFVTSLLTSLTWGINFTNWNLIFSWLNIQVDPNTIFVFIKISKYNIFCSKKFSGSFKLVCIPPKNKHFPFLNLKMENFSKYYSWS